MTKFQISVLALLIAIAVGTTVTAVEVTKIARDGMQMEITAAEAQEIAEGVNEAIAAKEAWEGER